MSFLMFLLSAGAAYWIFNDTKKMGFSSSKCFIWALFTFFFWYVALPIYFLTVRDSRGLPKRSQSSDNIFYGESSFGRETVDVSEKVTCPKCGKQVPSSFSHCPHCGYAIKPQCRGCGKNLEPGWKICPHCETPVEETENKDNAEARD